MTGRRSTSTPIGEPPISTPTPEPFAFPVPAGPELRGQIWAGNGDTVLLVHDVGQDLDAWGSIATELTAEGYRVVAIDLPGHGLSDDPWDAGAFPAITAGLIASLRASSSGRCFAIATGSMIPMVGLAAPDALVAISPRLAPDWVRETTGVPCLILVGSADRDSAADAETYFRKRTGWCVVSNFGVPEKGTALLGTRWSTHIMEQTISFLRDYRTQPEIAEGTPNSTI